MFSRGFRVAVRNLHLPSSVFLNKNVVSSSNLSSSTDWLKKSNPWKVVLNPNGITNPRTFLSLFSLPSATSKDKDGGTSKSKDGKDDKVKEVKKVFKEPVKIFRILCDYDEPHRHIIDGVNVLSKVLNVWRAYRPDFEDDYINADDYIEIPPNLYRFYEFLEDEEAASKKISKSEQTILKLLLEYDDRKFADKVLLQTLRFWKFLITGIECECMKWATNKDKHDVDEVKNPIPETVINGMQVYKIVFNDLDDPYDMVDIIKVVESMVSSERKNEMSGCAKMENEMAGCAEMDKRN